MVSVNRLHLSRWLGYPALTREARVQLPDGEFFRSFFFEKIFKKSFRKSRTRGQGGIEPPTSRTLSVNHTTRPLPLSTVWIQTQSLVHITSPCGPTDKASDYESGDSGFESQQGCIFTPAVNFFFVKILWKKNFFSRKKILVKEKTPPAGFEPATPGLEVRCAIQLRHGGNDPGGTRTHNR